MFSTKKRSNIMSKIKSKDTGPEMRVRRLVHSLGYRYRLHKKELPGCPDLVFKKKGKIIFVHGCFWHLHEGCSLNRKPKSHTDYWYPKLEKNKARDLENQRRLKEAGWDVLVVWECETKDVHLLEHKLLNFLENNF